VSRLTGNQLKLDGKISEYLPYYPKLIADHVSLKQLMEMRSGIPNYSGVDNGSFFNVVTRMTTTPKNMIMNYCVPKFFVTHDKYPDNEYPYAYSNCNYYILGDIIETATGKKFQETLDFYILDKSIADMPNTGMYEYLDLEINTGLANIYNFDVYNNDKVVKTYLNDPTTAYVAGAMYSSVQDFKNWDRILNTEEILNNEYKESMFTPWANSSLPSCVFFGLGWGVLYAQKGNFDPTEPGLPDECKQPSCAGNDQCVETCRDACFTSGSRTKVPFYMGSYSDSSYVTLLRLTEYDRAGMLFFNYTGSEFDIVSFLLEATAILAEDSAPKEVQ
jgi:CubicO group peptidase (beta-lactamase class C family)